jgi:hypothetical protein
LAGVRTNRYAKVCGANCYAELAAIAPGVLHFSSL